MGRNNKNIQKNEVIHKLEVTVKHEVTHKYELPKIQRLAFIFPVLYELIDRISQLFM